MSSPNFCNAVNFRFVLALAQYDLNQGNTNGPAILVVSLFVLLPYRPPALTGGCLRGGHLAATELKNIALPALSVAHAVYRAAIRPSRPGRFQRWLCPYKLFRTKARES